MPNSIITPQGVGATSAVCVTANSNLTAPTGAMQVLPPTTNGALLRRLHAIPRAAMTATQLQLFVYRGGAFTFLGSWLMPAQSVAVGTSPLKIDFGFTEGNPLVVEANCSLHVAIGVALAAGIAFRAEFGVL